MSSPLATRFQSFPTQGETSTPKAQMTFCLPQADQGFAPKIGSSIFLSGFSFAKDK